MCSSHLTFTPCVLLKSSHSLEKKSCFILLDRLDFHMIDNLSIAVLTFPMLMFSSLSVDEILQPRYMNWSTSFRRLPFSCGNGSFLFKTHELYLFVFMWRPMHLAATLGYTAEIRLEQVYLWEVLDHLHSLCLLLFLQDIVCFLSF